MENSGEIVINLTVNWQIFTIAALILMALSIALNELVTWLDDRHEGYTSLLVVVGVGYTVIAAAFVIGIGNALVIAMLFVASGIPMVGGEIFREIRKRGQSKREARLMAERLQWQQNASEQNR